MRAFAVGWLVLAACSGTVETDNGDARRSPPTDGRLDARGAPREDGAEAPEGDVGAAAEASDTSPAAGDTSPAAGDTSTPAGDTSPAAGDTSTVPGDTSTVPGDTSTVPGDTSPAADDTSTLADGAALSDAGAPGDSGGPPDVAAFDPGPDPCGEVSAFTPQFDADLGVYVAQDAAGAWPSPAVVFVGSSSVRRWETLAHTFADYAPIQRGLGGMQLGEVALQADALVTTHHPRGVVVYAGTNDLAFGVAPDVVLGRLACLRWRVGAALGWSTPVLFVGVTPTPARWWQWPTAAAFNAAAAALAAGDPGLRVVDPSALFLATGEPPAGDLFDPDGLHLSPKGYALWESAIRPAVEAALPPNPPSSATTGLAAGTRLLIDVGPSNPDDGELTPSPDYQGQHWNNWHALEGGHMALAGERLRGLVTTDGAPTGIDLVIAGGFLANGRQNGGLLWPDPQRLGAFATGSATGDFFYVENADAPGALVLQGLDPGRAMTLRLFAARDADEVRVTRYTAGGQTATLQTSGPGAGADGATTNDDGAVSLEVVSDAWGRLYVDVAKEQGGFAYLSAMELTLH